MEKRKTGCSILVILAMLLFACKQATTPGSETEDTSLPVEGPWSISDITGMLSTLSSVQSLQQTANSQLVSVYLGKIQQGLGNYVTTVRSNAPVKVASDQLSYTTTFQETGGMALKTWSLSGLAMMPISPSGAKITAPILAFQHGTQVNKLCAPSKFNPNPVTALMDPAVIEKAGALQNFVECVVGAYMASSGFIVAMPDYPGIGSNTDLHPYGHRSLGDSVRDAVKETIALVQSAEWTDKVAWNGRIYLLGYSEGGYATMVGAKSIEDDPVLSVTAAVPCDGAYDLSGTMAPRIAAGTLEIIPYYVPYVLAGYNYMYGDSIFRYVDVLSGAYATSLPPLFDGTHTTTQMKDAMPVSSSDPTKYAPRDVLTASAISALTNTSSAVYLSLQANDGYRSWTPPATMQMKIIHCATDDIVPVANADNAYTAFVNGGATTVTRTDVDPVDVGDPDAEVHLRAFPNAILSGFQFIDGIEASH